MTIILMRGLVRHEKHWGPFLPKFRMAFPDARILTFDLKGNGATFDQNSFTSIKENVEHFRSQIQANQPVILVSISLGSMVSVDWAARYPEQVKGLVLINTSDRGTSSIFERMRPKNYWRVFKLLRRNGSRLTEEEEILRMTSHLPEEDQHHWAKEFSAYPPTTKMNLARQLLAAIRFHFPRKRPIDQILMLSSLGDELVHPICSERIAKMWNLKQQIHPTSGHDLPMQEPDWVIKCIQNWLKSFPEDQLQSCSLERS